MSNSLFIEPIEQSVEIAEGQNLLDACLRAGIWLPHACVHGLCGTCKVEVLDGEVDHGNASPFALMDFERDEGMTLACCATAEGDVTIEADIEEEPDAVVRAVSDFTATVSRLERLTPDILGVWLKSDQPIEFQAGQYLNLMVAGVAEPRAFSFASSPSADEIELHIRLVPGGEATPRIHKHLTVGDQMSFTAPYGRFFVRTSADRPLLFMAGGSGLSSPKAMIEDLLESGCELPITLIHGVRTTADLYLEGFFELLADKHDNFRYIPALSEPGETDDAWSGEVGFVNDVAERLYDGSFKGLSAYLCGPPPMIEACIRSLMKGRLFERDIFTEKFLTLADAQNAIKSPLFRGL